jgi:hypothetical protein
VYVYCHVCGVTIDGFRFIGLFDAERDYIQNLLLHTLVRRDSAVGIATRGRSSSLDGVKNF